MEQIGVESYPEYIFQIADAIVNNLNPSGYLEIDHNDIIKELGVSSEQLEETLGIILRLDPIGCGARNLKECLISQAKIFGYHSELLALIINEHLER